MVDVVSTPVATYSIDPLLANQANGHVLDATEWNQVVQDLRSLNVALHGASGVDAIAFDAPTFNPIIRAHSGDPEGVAGMESPPGGLVLGEDGVAYIKQTGTSNTGYAALTAGGGGGTDLTGLGVDNRAARWNGANIIQSSGVTIDDSGNVLTAGYASLGSTTLQANGIADNLQVGATGTASSVGISILSSGSGIDYLLFGRSGQTIIGGLSYQHTTDALTLRANNGDRVTVQSTGVTLSVGLDMGSNAITSSGTIDTTGTLTVGDGTAAANAVIDASDAAAGTLFLRKAGVTRGRLDIGGAEQVRLRAEGGTSAGGIYIEGTNGNVTIDSAQFSPEVASQTLTGAASACTIDWNDGNYHHINVDAAGASVAMTLNNPIDGAFYRICFHLTDNGESHAITWPATVHWKGDSTTVTRNPGALDTTGDATDYTLLVLLHYDGTAGLYMGYFYEAETAG